MLQPFLDATTVPLLERMAVFGERRQQVLAGNLANIDTPDYRMRDLPVEQFQQALKEAVARRQAPVSPGHPQAAPTSQVADLFPDELFRSVEAPSRHITFQDANNRSIEHEVMEMTKNAMMQGFAVELMNAQLNLLHTVITERA